jgi:AcrR family transcriptional regulator
MFGRLAPEKRRQVLDAAARVFARKGLDGANIRELSTACGVSRGSLYDYFKNKEELLETVAQLALSEMAETHERAIEEGGGFFATLERIFRAGIEYVDRHPHYALIYLQVAGRGEPILRPELLQQVEARAADQYRDLLRAGIERGELRPGIDLNIWAFTIDSMWTAFATCLSSPHLQVRLHAYLGLDASADRRATRGQVEAGLAALLAQIRSALSA